VWVADPADAAVDEFGPTGADVSQETGSGVFSGNFVRSVAVNDATQFSYVADSGPDKVDVFDNAGAFVTQWDGSTTLSGSFGGGFIYAAVDNSTGPSAGDVYVTDSSHGLIDKLGGGTATGSQPTPVDFSGSAPYVSGSEITGTPSGSFGNLQGGVTVRSSGNIYAIDQGNEVVDEFSQAGTFVQQFTGSGAPGGSFGQIAGVAVDNATGNVYVVDSANNAVDEFSSSGGFVAQLTGSGTPAGAFSSPQGVAIDASGDVYVTDGGNRVVDKFGPGVLLTPKPPAIDSQYATQVSSDSATLQAQINPRFGDTSYHFEYGTGDCATNSCTSVPIPDQDIGSGNKDVAVSQHAQGLQPGTTYHYRVVATNSAGTTDGVEATITTQAAGSPGPGTCPNAAFRSQQNDSFLPDCRAYEQVTPANKGDAQPSLPTQGVGVIQASVNGDAMAYFSLQALPGSPSGGGQPYLATRGASGWSSQALGPPQAAAGDLLQYPKFNSYALDLSKTTLMNGSGAFFGQDDPPLVPGEPPNNRNLFLRDNASASYQLLDPVSSGASPAQAEFQGASTDLSHVVFDEAAPLTQGAPGAGVFNLYQWSGGALTLVSVLPNGDPAPDGGSIANIIGSPGGGSLDTEASALNAVSADGSRVFFFVRPVSSFGVMQLYVRLNPAQPQSPLDAGGHCTVASDACTVEASASQKTNGSGPGGTDPNGPLTPNYWPAPANGSSAFFTNCEQLTNDSSAFSPSPASNCAVEGAPNPEVGNDLYRYDIGTGQLTDLTVDKTDALGAQVQGVLGASSDGSYVYFVANGVLAKGAAPGNCNAGSGQTVGACNLYVSHNGATTFIARLDGSDAPDWNGKSTARVTPDGTHLAFDSIMSLTGYDNTVAGGSSCGPDPRQPGGSAQALGTQCVEVFLYDATSGQLRCASCNPSGARPVGSSGIDPEEALQGNGINHLGTYLPRNLSDDGSRLFFDSSDALVADDTNGEQDVYEYTAGQPHLISSGSGNSSATFMDATPSGSDVFFATSDSLVSQDTDAMLDVYDARVDGGFAAPSPSPPPCQGDTCRASLSAPVTPATAASVNFLGPRNPTRRGVTSKVTVLSKTVHGSTFFVRVKVPARGRITISGNGVKRMTRSIGKGGTYQLKVTLTATQNRMLNRSHKLKVKVRVAYAPATGNASVATAKLTVMSATRHHAPTVKTRQAGGDQRAGAR